MATKELINQLNTSGTIETTGSIKALDEIATSLYKGLRAFDHADVDMIFAEVYPEMELGGGDYEPIRKRLLVIGGLLNERLICLYRKYMPKPFS